MDNQKILKLKDFSEDIDEAEVVDIIVAIDESISMHDSVLTLETNKTSVDLGCPFNGEIKEIFINIGDKIDENTNLVAIEVTEISVDASTTALSSELEAELVVIGGGPAGYTAAFRAADLGVKTILIDKYPELGGTCLNNGCIPSKFLLHIVSGIHNAKHLSEYGVKFDEPFIDLRRMMQAKDSVINTLNSGLRSLSNKRNINVIHGTASFSDNNLITVKSNEGSNKINFTKAIIATGSAPRKIDSISIEDPRILYSEQALNIQCVPNKLLVVGGGVIGLELSSVFHGLGSNVTVIEATSSFLSMLDEDIVAPLIRKYQETFNSLMTDTLLDEVQVTSSGLAVRLMQDRNVINTNFDAILIATGREPITQDLNLDVINVDTDDYGYIDVNDCYCTSVENIYAIGDVIGNPMLAHKGSKEGRIVAEICAGHRKASDKATMPFVVYTDPEIAWVGLTESSAGNEIDVVKSPWLSNGRALTQDSSYGLTKLLVDRETGKIVGGGLVGPNVGEMISEITLAIENQLTVKDLSKMIHPHPTVSETIAMCAEKYLKEAVEILNQ